MERSAMIESVYIRNFKAIDRGVYKFFGHDVVLVGESNAGKTSLIEALDCFFNRSHIDSSYFVDRNENVRIGVQVDGCKYMREFDPTTLRGAMLETDGDWSALSQICLVHVASSSATFCNVAAQVAHADAVDQLAGSDVAGELGGLLQQRMRGAGAAGMAGADADDGGAGGAGDLGVRISGPMFVDLRSSVGTIGIPGAGCDADGNDEDAKWCGLADPQLGVAGSGGSRSVACKAGAAGQIASLLISGSHPNAILAIDDIENLLGADLQHLSKMERCFAQTIVSTNSADFAHEDANTITYPITEGATPGPKVAQIVGSVAAQGKMLVLVEGQYDLPWYKRAVELLGLADSVFVIPGGGSNSGVLLKEMRRIGIPCILIRDGDMRKLSNPRNGDYALQLDCIEMYAPDRLLRDCFGVVPPRRKDVFFKTILRNASNFPHSIRGDKKRFGRDDIKGIIAAKANKYLDANSRLVQEVDAILRDAMGQWDIA